MNTAIGALHHVEGNIASAQVATAEYLDHLHLSKTSGNWRIVHDLFRQARGGGSDLGTDTRP
ncbi:nuclear transport factor 2 family protein [Promicromonospora panici]|uniref:nuclear transport factor 2 family protein n=1 Tax=Promicromonospora panici TaxID=2219658 RepID=UPI00101E0A28|nr:nuclear transport factor 2 family protein [Promicromonospora panici]